MKTELKPEEIRNVEKFVRNRKPNMDYGFMNVLLLVSKHCLKLLDEHKIKLYEADDN